MTTFVTGSPIQTVSATPNQVKVIEKPVEKPVEPIEKTETENIVVIKRDGFTKQPFDKSKIDRAIQKAFAELNKRINGDYIDLINLISTHACDVARISGDKITVDQIQAIVKRDLIKSQYPDVAEAYIIYASKRDELRKARLVPSKDIISDYIQASRYARHDAKLKRRELYKETNDRVRKMHIDRYPMLKDDINWAFNMIDQKKILPSMRSRQFGGKAIEVCHARQYNCSFSPCNRPEFFQEALYLLLAGCGVGFSVQFHHVEQLPALKVVDRFKVKHFSIPDTIEGWSESLGELIQSYIKGHYVEFNYSRIRDQGMPLVVSGGKAPGHLPLKEALDRIRVVLDGAQGRQLEPIECCDITCMAADAVYCGGIREAALICLFSFDDPIMRVAKTGNWHQTHPWRVRSNNSVVLVRKEASKNQFMRVFKSIKEFGEPGFFFTDDPDYGCNPCLTGDMKLVTPGGYKTLRELWESGGRHEYSKDKPIGSYGTMKIINRHGIVDASNVYRTGMDDVYSVVLSGNHVIKATANHEFIVLDGGFEVRRKLKDLKPGDNLFIKDDPFGRSIRCSVDYIRVIVPCGAEETFCLTEPVNHEIIINDMVIGQCCEVGMNSKLVITPETKAWVEEWAAKSGRKIPKLKIGQVYWGFQFCNLTEVNASACKTPDELYEAVRAAAFVGTVQAGYQDFPYLGWVTEAITARESLLGVSMTGIMDNPTVALDPEVQKTAAQTAIEENMRVARIIGINPAARVSTVKPSGSASLLLGCSAGIHPHHARRYFRRIRSTPDCSVYQEFKRVNPHWCTKINRTKELITVPVQASHGAMIRKDLTAIQFLKHVLSTKLNWIDAGTARPSSSPGLTHNVSNTVTVKPDEWDAVAEFIWQNRQNFGGVTLLAYVGDKVYENAPFEEVVTEADEARWQHLIKSYKAVDWACFNEEVDGTSLAGEVACAGGACEFST